MSDIGKVCNKHEYSISQIIQCLNRACNAYFCNICENNDIHLHNLKYNHSSEKECEFFLNRIEGRSIIQIKNLNEFNKIGIEKFFNRYLMKSIKKEANKFSKIIKQYKLPIELVFMDLSDCVPFHNDFCRDKEQGFASRLTYSNNFASSDRFLIFDFNCIVLRKKIKESNV